MHSIPMERYAGSVVARGVYGLPSIASIRPSRRTLLILALIGFAAVLVAAGWVDLGGGMLLAAGPIATTGSVHAIEAEMAKLETEYDAIAPAADGTFTDEQNARRDQILASHTDLDAEYKRALTRRDWERTAPGVPDEGSASAGEPPKPFASMGEQLQAIYAAATQPHRPVHPGLVALNQYAAASGANEIVGSDGGFAVQSDYESDLLQRVYARSTLADRCATREIGPNSNSVKVNHIDETSRADGSRFGGVRAYWTGEATALTASRPKMTEQELNLTKLTGLYYPTDEEMQDAVALQSGIEEMFPAEFGFKVDDAIVRGTGAGIPQGWLTANGTVSVAKESAQGAATILSENVEKMFARLWAPSMKNAYWYINQQCYPQLFQMQHVIGTGGVPVFMPPGGLASAPYGLLFGRPIEPIEQASALGTVGDISLVDLSEYRLVKKGGIKMDSSIHVLFTTDEMAFRWVLRINGRPKWLSALTPYKGADTLSPFVTLATRA